MLVDGSPRLGPAGVSAVGPLNWLLCRAAARSARVERVHLFDALARQRWLFRAWLLFASQMMPGGTLPRDETELVILRVAHLRRCDYELAHHARMARRAGLDEDALARVERGPEAPGWTARQRAMLSFVDELVGSRSVGDATWAAAAEHLSDAKLIELCLLVGHYEMLATTIGALRLAPDTPIHSERGRP